MENVEGIVCIYTKFCELELDGQVSQEKGLTVRSKLVPIVPQLVQVQAVEKDQLH